MKLKKLLDIKQLWVAGVNINGSGGGAANTCQSYGGQGNPTIAASANTSMLIGATWANTSVLPPFVAGKSVSISIRGKIAISTGLTVTLYLYPILGSSASIYTSMSVYVTATAADSQPFELNLLATPTAGTSGATQTYSVSGIWLVPSGGKISMNMSPGNPTITAAMTYTNGYTDVWILNTGSGVTVNVGSVKVDIF